jgi:hypothetical protein
VKRILVVALALTAALLGGLFDSSATVADGIQVTGQAAENQFPDGLNFTVSISSTADITSVRLHYKVLPDGSPTSVNSASQTQVQANALTCSSGKVVGCAYVLGNTPASYMAPGTEIHYSWEIEDADGNKLTTDQEDVIYNDTRFKWQSIENGQVTVNYYSGGDSINQQILQAASDTITKFNAIEGTNLDSGVKIWVYANDRDLAAAGQTGNIGGVLEGLQPDSNTALVARGSDSLKITQHEVTHLVTARATRSDQPVGDSYTRYDIPLWINEGTSVYAQGGLIGSQQLALDMALRTGQVLPITSLTPGTREDVHQVDLWYAESGALVGFLIDTYGNADYAAFIKAMKDNSTDAALQKVYGFDQLGWENQWRKSAGLPEVEDSVSGSQPSRAPIPTLVPLGSAPQASSASPAAAPTPRNASSSESASSDNGGSSALPIVVAIVIVLGAGGFVLLKRRSSTPVS